MAEEITKLTTIWKTLTVTRNPLTALQLKKSKTRKNVTFKNSKASYCLTWPQFRVFRDHNSFLEKYQVKQVEDDSFRISNHRSQVTCSSDLLPMMFDLMEDFAVNQKEGLFHLKNTEMELLGSLDMLYCFQELRKGDYEGDYKGKVVLDVGGFEGESAAYFWSKGAKRIVVYEPLAIHIENLKKNFSINGIEGQINQLGVAEEDGTQEIEYQEMNPGFGIAHKGPNCIKIKVKSFSKVIDESGAEVAKLDCEGAEIHVVSVPLEILRKVTTYIIETHSPGIRKAILEKFKKSGFKLVKEKVESKQYSVLTFKRI